MPGHGNVITGAVTAKNVAAENKCRQLSVLPASNTVKRQRADFVSIVHNMQIGQNTMCNVRSQILSGIVQNLAWHNVVPVLPVLEDAAEYDIDQSYLKQIFCTTDENQLICRWCLQNRYNRFPSDTIANVLQRFEISDATKSSVKHTTLQCIPVGYHGFTNFKGIMSSCLAPTDMLKDCHVTPVLYVAALRGRPFALDAVAVLDSLDSSSVSHSQTSDSVRTFSVGKKWVWSCVWSPGLNNQFAVGTEKLAYLFDANTGKRFALDTKSSDVLSLAFTSSVSVLFYVSETDLSSSILTAVYFIIQQNHNDANFIIFHCSVLSE